MIRQNSMLQAAASNRRPEGNQPISAMACRVTLSVRREDEKKAGCSDGGRYGYDPHYGRRGFHWTLRLYLETLSESEKESVLMKGGRSKHVLVAGGAGFLGSHLCDAFSVKALM
jgi:hypothetical protein